MRIRAAIFDVFGTVVDWREGVAAAVAGAFAAKDLDDDARAFADAWRGEYQPGMEAVRSGARGYVQLDDLHLENLDRALAAQGLEGKFDAAEKADLNRAWERLPPWPDAREGLARIRRLMPAATCSNGSIALMTSLARFGGLQWDCILGADIAKDYKPEAMVYRASCAALRTPPDEVVMVAAHNPDLAAARAAGLRTAFIPRPDEKGPGRGEAHATEDWDLVAKDMIDLAGALAAATAQ